MNSTPLILVVGMHRSGTSLLGNLLHSAGVSLPGPLIAGDQNNPEGYFERADITYLQEELLIALDRWWPSATGMEPLPGDWLCRSVTQRYRSHLAALLATEQKRQQSAWAIKDPRTSLLLPLWRPLCSALGISLRVVLALRDPHEVVASLCQRDALPAGMTAERAEAIWRHHNYTVLRQAAGLPLLMVNYGHWFVGPGQAREQLQRVLTFCGVANRNQSADVLECALAQVKPQLRRSHNLAGTVNLHKTTKAIYGALANGDANQAMAWFASAQPSPQSTPIQMMSGFSPGKRARLRAHFWAWRSRRADRKQVDVPLIEPGSWFDTDHYCAQLHGMAACSRSTLLHHYRTIGWLAGCSPHNLFDTAHYKKSCDLAGISLHGNALDHWLSAGQLHMLTPHPLADASWLLLQPSDGRTMATLSLSHLHPWGAAAEAISANPSEARNLLAEWLSADQLPLSGLLALLRHTPSDTEPHSPSPGLAQLHPWGAAAEAISANPSEARNLLAEWLEQEQLNPEALATLATLPADPPPPSGSMATGSPKRSWRAIILGSSWLNWQTHALLQHLPWHLDPEQAIWCESWPTSNITEAKGDSETLTLLVLHLQPLELTNQQGLLPALAGKVVIDMRPEQVRMLRWLGINAHSISAASPLRHPLLAASAEEASSSMGLPSPKAIAASNASGMQAPLCLGSTGALWERSLDSSCWCLPAFHSQANTNAPYARQLAAWLQACQLAGIQLVELAAPSSPVPFDGFEFLAQPEPKPAGWLPVQRFRNEITPAELQAELSWRRQGSPPPPPCSTPTPKHRCIWKSCSQAPDAAVCVSLYNYAVRIEETLKSVHTQTLSALELIVVDDASSDGSSAVVLAWLERHSQRFARTLLLQHEVNSGLAAARNTAFAAAEASWCFVLDADNQLKPEAVAQCLAVAHHAPATTAVVHPLVALAYEQPDTYARTLLSHQSWQRECFQSGNYVDAMALVRRSAWQQVGGYTHIPGGWEDFDFWCSLIDAGLHGVLCPQLLAVYNVHDTSMAATCTRRLERPLSRLLMQRHPWLRLPLAAEAL